MIGTTRDGNKVQHYLNDPERRRYGMDLDLHDLPDYQTEEELHQALFGQELHLYACIRQNCVKISNRYSQWLSTRLDHDGVLVPRIMNGFPDTGISVSSMTHALPAIELRKKGKVCCRMHERLIRELNSKGDPPPRNSLKSFGPNQRTYLF
jgi:hypothetical protein